jgi:hypothetical protein
MDVMTMDDMQAVNMVLRECSTYIPIELEHDVAIVDLTAIDMDKLGRGLSNACVPRLLQAYRPDFKMVDWWLNGCQTNRKLKCKTTDRIGAWDKQISVYSVSGKPYTLSAKGRGQRKYRAFGIRVFGRNHTAYLHSWIYAEVFARVHPSTWNRVKTAWDVDYLTWTGYTVHHILPYETLTGNTPLNLVLLDDWTHETTKVQYNQLRRRIIDHDLDMSKTLILPKNGAMQALQNIPVLA